MKSKWFDKILSYIFMFFAFSFIGYVWEVCLFLVETGQLVNRGTMYGPWLPIYGTGGLVILILLKRFKKKPLLVFISALLVCTTIEYFTSYFLEMTKGIRWWDYSNYLININGRVCLEGAVVFGLAGCLAMYIAEPFFVKMSSVIPKRIKIILCILLLSLFLLDFTYSASYPNVGEGVSLEKTKA